MIRSLVLFIGILISSFAYSDVCAKIRSIEGFSTSLLFENSIINNKPLDYYIFNSQCDINCLKIRLKKLKVSYKYKGSVLSLFDKQSVATLTLESVNDQVLSGYLTCSSVSNRKYIGHPLKLNLNKVSLDLQTEDYKNITRTINLQGYTKSEYKDLVSLLTRLSKSRKNIIGFTEYSISNNKFKQSIKLTRLNSRGDLMVVIEVNK